MTATLLTVLPTIQELRRRGGDVRLKDGGALGYTGPKSLTEWVRTHKGALVSELRQEADRGALYVNSKQYWALDVLYRRVCEVKESCSVPNIVEALKACIKTVDEQCQEGGTLWRDYLRTVAGDIAHFAKAIDEADPFLTGAALEHATRSAFDGALRVTRAVEPPVGLDMAAFSAPVAGDGLDMSAFGQVLTGYGDALTRVDGCGYRARDLRLRKEGIGSRWG